jgi:hypothetical protein
MACENDKCEKYGLHHEYKDGIEIKKCHACKKDDNMTIIKEKGELFPFICPDCRGFNDCEYSENGLCLCPWCDEKKIEQYEKDYANKSNNQCS